MSLSRRAMLASSAGLLAGGVLGTAASENVWGQAPPQRIGLALTIGLGELSGEHYSSLPEKLPSCLNDAQAMTNIATNAGFHKVIQLTNGQATRFEVSRHIYHASQHLKPGDLFLVTISSHGFTGAVGKTPDVEETGKDQGWCLYDWMMVDDEIYNLWRFFAAGVRILAIVDTCHSGTSAKMMNYAKSIGMNPLLPPVIDAQPKGKPINPKSLPTPDFAKNISKALRLDDDSPAALDVFYPAKAIPAGVVKATYAKSKPTYDAVLQGVVSKAKGNEDMVASGLLIASSQDSQSSYAGPVLSAFTRELVEVWQNPPATYRDLHAAVVARLRWQTPNFYPFGVSDPQFHQQRPFSI
jgi:Caspase domain.